MIYRTWLWSLGLLSALGLSVLWAQEKPGAKPPAPPPGPPPASAPKAEKAPAIIIVRVPANATIWIEGQKMTQTGPVRSFQSPPLEPGKTYYYTFKVSWPTAPGQPETSVTREVTVQGGVTTSIDFGPQPAPVYQPVQPVPARPGFFVRPPEGSGYR